MSKAIFLCNTPKNIDWVYGSGRRERIAELTELYPEIVTKENIHLHLPAIQQTERDD